MNKQANLQSKKDTVQYINLQLASLGQPLFHDHEDDGTKFCNPEFEALTNGLIKGFKEKSRLLAQCLSPADQRIQNFIDSYLQGVDFDKSLALPNDTLVLTQAGHARELSLPPNGDSFISEDIITYRIKQGILNNPSNDKRTTVNTFHIVEGDLPAPLDKKEVPKITFAHFLHAAFHPSDELKILPFTANQADKAKVLVSLLLRPMVCPEVKGVIARKSMEVRFFTPGSLVSNLDFVESIFGNAGDPYLAQNDAGLDTAHWTGHTGCVILAPQLRKLRKKEVGLPHWEQATDRQRHEGMCWKSEDEIYNDGGAFKVTCRDDRGVVVTIIADNYFGYSKKEIKTQISYAANLYGLVEEEHSGGAIAYPKGVMGDIVDGSGFSKKFGNVYSFEEAKSLLGERIEVKSGNYAVDKKYPNLIYIPENAYINTNTNSITWMYEGLEQKLVLSPNKTYVHPTGNKFRLEKHKAIALWRIVNTSPEGVFCHKPCTVSGGGKSEISKSMLNAITYSEFNIIDIDEDFKKADEIIEYDYSKRWKNYDPSLPPSESFLSPKRTLGAAVRLLQPLDVYTDEYNNFVRNIPVHIRSLVLFVKRLYRQDGNNLNWKECMSVDVINGKNGTGLKYFTNPVVGSYVRIGFSQKGNWLLNKLRSDFSASEKIQMEDDISASITLPRSQFKKLNPEYTNRSLKVVANCESYLFQRPDEAIVRGYDKGAERDIVSNNTFLTNFELLRKQDAIDIYEDTVNFDKYTQPVKDLILDIVNSPNDEEYFCLPSHTRIVDGKPTKNPRYLERNIFIQETEASYLGEIGTRLYRKMKSDDPFIPVVNAVLPGRRNNPVDKKAGIRPLAVYNPIHYQEAPELFMDFICSLTGKSPSTTGAGSEGALTKGPFNMLTPTTDLNNALLSHILTDANAFSTAAGYVGAQNRVDHDISLLIPEIWARLAESDRDPKNLIQNGCLEKIDDFEYQGKKVLASRLGYRITERFSLMCLNRLFDEPQAVFNEKMLKPELQGLEDYVDGINNIVEAQQKVALSYFEDGSIEAAIPPLKVLLHVMAYGHFEGQDISDPELRKLFDRQAVVDSDWYKARLVLKQDKDIAFYTQQMAYLKDFMADPKNAQLVEEMKIRAQLDDAKDMLATVSSKAYLESLVGTIGCDPLYRRVS
ncbi:hypothetical protein [Rhodoferax fermentans]|uniref:PPi-type phosphoenolpyruvate carboxykinase lobe 2 domain-containing protein n=1 Tax=Rhodoferax fermentans TaxID=28066 RepID=A0A1T1AW92_RHOFE|nr:hypothetical protein [Rhodoferax fermentans]MBK1685610.1 hypothetical protein [Rhodoferax fermentans]OOV08351.1 hypothetical protein RF819_18040 [Rhodoferax fermentans]